MKKKLRTIELVLISLVVILDAYLINIGINDSYKSFDNSKFSANYIETKNIETEVEEIDPVVFDGKTMNQLSEQIDKSLNSTISGKGQLIASYSLEKGVDPYMATAIILQETGCKWECSYLVNACNNVGGQKGEGCNGYNYYPTIDDGIKAFIDNLYYNYISQGLITLEDINKKYAADQNWHLRVNKYVESIKAQ